MEGHKATIVTAIMLLAVLMILFLLLPKSEVDELWGYEFERTSDAKNIRFLLFDDGDERIEAIVIEDVSPISAKKLIDEKTSVFAVLFENQRVGYSGQHTEYVSCADKYKPEFHEKQLDGGELKYFKGYANSRYAVGVCLQEDIAFLSFNLYLYCRGTNTIYDLDYFVALSNADSASGFVDKLHCRQD